MNGNEHLLIHFQIQIIALRKKELTMAVETAMTRMVKRQVPLGNPD